MSMLCILAGCVGLREEEEEEEEEEEATRQRPIYLLVETQAALPRTGQA
jgi:hypothetical protein